MAEAVATTKSEFQGFANDVIGKFLPTRIAPQKLYHYTSSEGLMGIVCSNAIRFSDAAYMNDGSEIRHGFDVLDHVLDVYMKDKDASDQEIARRLRELLEAQSLRYRQVIFCLCEENNLLNQWRDYGRDVVPYSIEFDLQGLVERDGWNFTAALLPLVYDYRDKFTSTNELVDRIYKTVKALKREDINPERETALYHSAAAEIQWLLYQFKNDAFLAEKEWRMIALTPFIVGQAPKFRASNLGVIPYYEWKLKDETRKLPISKVTVGPSPYAQVSDLALKQFLAVKGYEKVQTDYSTIPIRRT